MLVHRLLEVYMLINENLTTGAKGDVKEGATVNAPGANRRPGPGKPSVNAPGENRRPAPDGPSVDAPGANRR